MFTGTNSSSNPSGSTQNRQLNINGSYNNRNPYRTNNRQNIYLPFIRTYYYNTNTNLQEGKILYNEQAKYQAFKDDYYSTINQTQLNKIIY